MRRRGIESIGAASLLFWLVLPSAAAERLPAEMQDYAAHLQVGVEPLASDHPLLSDEADDGTVHAGQYTSCIGGLDGGCDGRPSWTRYAVFDFLFLQPNNATRNGPLAIENELGPAPGTFALVTDAMESSMAPGVRLFYGSYGSNDFGWEIGWIGLWSLHADTAAFGDETLRLPGDLGTITDSGFDRASAVEASRLASLNMVELNFLDTARFGGRHPCAKRAMHRSTDYETCRDWILGIRWASLEDSASLDVTAEPGDLPTSYRVTTSSNLIGPQAGYRRRTEWRHWAVETFGKAAVVGSILSQSQGPVVGPFDGVTIRGPQSSDHGGMGMIGDLNFTIERRLGENWGLRLGYNLMWISGLALAADQWDFSDTASSGTALHGTGSLFLHGVNLGLDGRW